MQKVLTENALKGIVLRMTLELAEIQCLCMNATQAERKWINAQHRVMEIANVAARIQRKHLVRPIAALRLARQLVDQQSNWN